MEKQQYSNNIFIYLSLYFLFCILTVPVFLSHTFLRLFWLYSKELDLEIIESICYTSEFILFPMYFFYLVIKKVRGLAFKISIVGLGIFIIQVVMVVCYLYLVSRTVQY